MNDEFCSADVKPLAREETTQLQCLYSLQYLLQCEPWPEMWPALATGGNWTTGAHTARPAMLRRQKILAMLTSLFVQKPVIWVTASSTTA
eukprot:s1936_g2.t1